MSSLTETENKKKNNIQINKQKKQQNKKQIKPHKKKCSESFTTMLSWPDTALTDFISNLNGIPVAPVQCSCTENHMLDACIQNFFPSFNFV